MPSRRTTLRLAMALDGALAVGGGATPARADIMAAGTIKVAVPQDFPPFGSVGADITPGATTSTSPV